MILPIDPLGSIAYNGSDEIFRDSFTFKFEGSLRLTKEAVLPLDYSTAATFSDSATDRLAVCIVYKSAIDLEVQARLALLDDAGALTFWGFLRFCDSGRESVMTLG